MSAKKLSAKLTIDQIAELFDLPPWGEIEDLNLDNYLECAESAIADFEGTEEEREEAYYQAQDRARDRLFHAWHNAVTQAAERELGTHEIELAPYKVRGKVPDYPYQYRLKPAKSWHRAANLIRETINGVGYFYFPTLRDLCLSGPYTPREAALAHLGYVPRRHEVYGDESARRSYERSMQAFEF